MKKTIKLITMLILGVSFGLNFASAQVIPPGDGVPNIDFPPPVNCNLFPICFNNISRCEIEMCFTISYRYSGPVDGDGTGTEHPDPDPMIQSNSVTRKICKTIKAGENICITEDEFRAAGYTGPSSYQIGPLVIDPRAVYDIRYGVEITGVDGTALYSHQQGFNNKGESFDLNPYDGIDFCGNSRLIYKSGCPGSYTITRY